MINLAVNAVSCECGSFRLAPHGNILPGEVCICASCARVYRVGVALTPLRWSEVEQELEHRPHDLQAFQWTRAGVPPEKRATLAELVERGSHFDAEARSLIALAVVVAFFLGIEVLRVVFS